MNIGFDEALKFLKRKYKVTRSQWNNNMFLELRTDDRGNREIFSASEKSNGIRHTFDQNEIMAHDWRVL
jgi:hypothetical protein